MEFIKNKLNKEHIVEFIRIKFRKIYINKTVQKRKKLINNNDFTIISNNCWGGIVYQSYGITYKSPTIGMYIMPDDYIKFLNNLKYYISLDLKFINPLESIHYDELLHKDNFGSHPIGKLDDVELMFLHYKSEEEAYEKWKRRCKRINWNKIIVKFNDQNNCKDENIIDFDKLNYKHKIFFSAKKHANIKSEVYLKEAEGQENIRASQEPFGKSKYIDINNLINSL